MFVAVLVAGVLSLFASPVGAVPINYGDQAGATVNFLQVTESTISPGDPDDLFGAPTVSGDSIDFDPINFFSSASGAGGIDSTIGLLTLGIEAQPGYGISELLFTEAGDYTIFGSGGAGTEATVSAPIFIDILEVNGAPITQIDVDGSLTFSPSNGDYNLADDGSGFGVIWNGSFSLDLDQVLLDNGFMAGDQVTLVSITLNNILTTTSELGTQAIIQKKDVSGFGISVIPEPTTAVLLGLGLTGLAVRRGRERAA